MSPKRGPRAPMLGVKSTQERAKTRQQRSKTRQERPKSRPRGGKKASKRRFLSKLVLGTLRGSILEPPGVDFEVILGPSGPQKPYETIAYNTAAQTHARGTHRTQTHFASCGHLAGRTQTHFARRSPG